MEPAIDRRTIARGEGERLLRLIAPAVEQRRRARRPGSRLGSAAVRKMTRAPGRAVRVISPPQGVELRVGHPVLRVEQHVTVERSVGPGLQILGERAVEHLDASARARMVSKWPARR